MDRPSEASGGPLTRSTGRADLAALRLFLAPSDSRLWRLIALLRRGVAGELIQQATGIAPWFVAELERLIVLEGHMRAAAAGIDDELLVAAKRACFGDRDIATLTGLPVAAIGARRDELGLHPGFAMVDTSAAEFAAETPYFYSTYAALGSPPEAPPVERPASLVIGSGPVRIGQGIEFDYCAVQASDALRRLGHQSIMVNSNPETVSTDFDASSRLYFESLDAESVLEVLRAETLDGDAPDAFVQFGGQTPLGLATALAEAGIRLRGLDLDAIDQTEERMRFAGLVDRLGIPQPEGGMAASVEEAFVVAERVGYPVIVRPSFVIGGLAVDFAYSPDDLALIIARAVAVDDERPVRIDAYLEGIELDVDAITDGTQVLIPGLIEHVERAGVHSGDSIGIYPPQRISAADQQLVVEAMTRVALAVGVRGLINGQFIIRDDGVYLLEVNPRASRTVPFLSKVTGVPMIELATRVALGESLESMGWASGLAPGARLRRGQGAGLLDHQAARRRPHAGAGDAVDRRGHRPALGPRCRAWPRHSPRPRCDHPSRARRAASRSSRWPTATSRAWRIWPRPSSAPAIASARRAERRSPCACWAMPLRRWCPSRGRAVARRSVLEAIRSGDVDLVVNSPSPESRPVRDAGAIRRAALAEGILCLTSIDTAVAAARALDPSLADRLADVRPLGEWLNGSRVPA